MKASRPGEHDVLSLFSEPEPSQLGWNGREGFPVSQLRPLTRLE